MIHDTNTLRPDVLMGLTPARIIHEFPVPLPPLRFHRGGGRGGGGEKDTDRVETPRQTMEEGSPRQLRLIFGESCCGQTKNGPEDAPRRIATKPFLTLLEALGWNVTIVRVKQIYVPSPASTGLHLPFSVAATCNAVTEAVVQAHLDGAVPVLLGGDHCLAMGSVRGSALAFHPIVRPLLEESAKATTPSKKCSPIAAAEIDGWENDAHAEAEGAAILSQGLLPDPRKWPSGSDIFLGSPAADAAPAAMENMSFASCTSTGEIPSLRGLLRSLTRQSPYDLTDNELCVVWIDAHADVNGPSSSPTGNMHGMPLAALLGVADMEHDAPGFTDGRFHVVTSRRVAWIGLRDVDVGERDLILRAEGNPHLDERTAVANGPDVDAITCAFDMHDVDALGVSTLVRRAMAKFPADAPIHVSFDVDSIDPVEAPSTGTPVDGGLRLHEVLEVLRFIRQTGRLVSIDVVEVNPALGDELDVARTVSCAQYAIAHALGAPSLLGGDSERHS